MQQPPGPFFDEASAHVILRCLRRRPLLGTWLCETKRSVLYALPPLPRTGVCESPPSLALRFDLRAYFHQSGIRFFSFATCFVS